MEWLLRQRLKKHKNKNWNNENFKTILKTYKIIFNSQSLLLTFIRENIKFEKRLTETLPEISSEMP